MATTNWNVNVYDGRKLVTSAPAGTDYVKAVKRAVAVQSTWINPSIRVVVEAA